MNREKITKTKLASTIAAILILIMTVSIFALPLANAHDPAWSIPTIAYISVGPDPIGVGQEANGCILLDKPS
jgi:hypothetical protein